MKLNRKLVMILALVMSLAMATGGTLAYLTDRESIANVFTVGDVKIKLEEADFIKDSKLLPGVTIDKTPTITNVGTNDAWVWMTVSVPTALDEAITLTGLNSDPWTFDHSTSETINDVAYTTYTKLYPTALAPNATTADDLTSVTLSSNVDVDPNGDWYLVTAGTPKKLQYTDNEGNSVTWNNASGNPVIYVSAYAIQKEQFADVQKAYEAYQGQWGNNGTEYADPQGNSDKAIYNGKTYSTLPEAVAAANANGGGTIELTGNTKLSALLNIASDITIDGKGFTIGRGASETATAAEGETAATPYAGIMINVAEGSTFTAKDLVLDGAGVTATGALVNTEKNANFIMEEGAALKNNNGAIALNLGTRIGATFTMNGGEISGNSADGGAIWGGGNITINDGKIINNSSSGVAGAIRMVSNCSLTMTGGEISGNTAASSGGAIYGYGASTYNFSGGKITGNTAAAGGAIYTGTYSTVNISGDFEVSGNTATEKLGENLRFTDHNTLNMTGGEVSGNNYGWTLGANLKGGNLSGQLLIQSGLTPTVGGTTTSGDGVINFEINTVHNTVNLIENFGPFEFTVAEGSNFNNFNLQPASGYTYTAGDEAKLICLNEGYETYWTGSVFKIQEAN